MQFYGAHTHNAHNLVTQIQIRRGSSELDPHQVAWWQRISFASGIAGAEFCSLVSPHECVA